MLAAINIHKAVFQAAVLDPQDGSLIESRFKNTRAGLVAWVEEQDEKLEAVALEATTGWRWVARELQQRGIDVRLADAGPAAALQGTRKRPKNDRLDACWLVMLLARDMLPESWLAPEDIQRLRDKTRLRKALTDDHTRWAQRLHAVLVHEGWPCSRGSLLTAAGRRWVAAIGLHREAREQIDAMLAVMSSIAGQIERIDEQLRAIGRATCACASCRKSSGSARFSPRRSWPRSATRAASAAPARSSASPALTQSCATRPTASAAATWPSRAPRTCAGRLSRPPSTTPVARTAPITSSISKQRGHAGANPATLTVARKIGKRAFHVWRELEAQPA
jgi:hypothetical protein